MVTTNAPKPKTKVDKGDMDCYNCKYKCHIAKETHTIVEIKQKKVHFDFSIPWDDCESSDDDDLSQFEFINVA